MKQSNIRDTLESAETRENAKIAALDLGSNSFHLVVARVVAGAMQIVHTVKQKARLADGLDRNLVLSDEAMERGLEQLRVITESINGFEPDSVRVVATHTLRRARNASKFIRAARNILPYPIEIISGTEEARLIYSGVAHTHHGTGKQLVVDIGGGSTEFVIGEQFDPLLCRSVQMGCVSYTKRFFKSGEIKSSYFDKAITAAEQAMELMANKYRKLGWKIAIGTSGTIKALVELTQTESSENLTPVTLKQLKRLKKECIESKTIQALPFSNLSEDRKQVLCAGLAILIAIFETLEIESLEYSPAALREGVLYQMEDALEHEDIRERTASSIVTRYDVDKEQALLILNICNQLFAMTGKSWKLDKKRDSSILSWAAMLHEVGMQIHSRGIQRHSAYIIQNIDMPGFNQEQQDLIATLVRFHRKKIRLNEFPEFSLYDENTVKRLLTLLRIAVILGIKRQTSFLPDFQCVAEKNKISLSFPSQWLETKPIIAADLERERDYLAPLDIELCFA